MTQTVNKLQIKKFIPGIAWFFIVMVLMCTPGAELPKVDWLADISFDKVIHMAVFAIMVILFCLPFYKTDIPYRQKAKFFLIITLAICTWGYCIELMQKYLIEGRSYSIVDAIANSIGAFIAFFFCKKKFA